MILFTSLQSLAQDPQYYNYNTTSSANSFPFNIPLGKEIQLLYLAGDFNQPTPAPAGNIVSYSFRIAANLGPYTYSNVVIKMGQTDITAFDPNVWYTGTLDTVYYRESVSLSALAGSWLTITLDRPFSYNPTRGLVVDIQQCGAPGATGFSQCTTPLTGFRRNTSLINTSCPMVWGQQSSSMNNTGITVAPSTCNYAWSNQVSGTAVSLRTVKAVSDMVAWAAGTSGAVRKTTDGGATWTDANPNPGVINGLIYNIEAIDANNAWCTTSPAATFIYRTTNGGVNWTQVFTQDAGFINGIQFINANTGYAMGDPVGARWSLWKSTDAGATWDSAGMYLPQAGAEAGWVGAFQVTPTGNVWFGTNNTRVYKSTNFGASYTFAATTGLVNSYSVYFNTASNGLAGGTTILKSTDGGASYTGVGTPPGTGNINGIQGKENDFWYIRGTGIYRSTNGGDNWTQVHTVTGTGNFIDFTEAAGCLVGWSVSSTGLISKMAVPPVSIGNHNNEVVSTYRLDQNYPNPFNPVTSITFAIPESGNVELKVFDILGREAATLLNDFRTQGTYTINFDAAELTSGVYFYKLNSGNFSEIRKMMLVK